MDVITAFTGEALATQYTIEAIGPAQWTAPALGEWTVADLVAHLVRAADRTSFYLDQPVEGDRPVCDRVAYFEFDTVAAAPGVATRARDDATRIGTDALADTFTRAWTTTAERVRDLPGDHLIHSFRGPMHLTEYLATRVLELTVHHLDLARALAVRPTTTDAGMAVTEAILLGLLEPGGQGHRPEGMDPASFVLAATGRELHPDPRFPVLS